MLNKFDKLINEINLGNKPTQPTSSGGLSEQEVITLIDWTTKKFSKFFDNWEDMTGANLYSMAEHNAEDDGESSDPMSILETYVWNALGEEAYEDWNKFLKSNGIPEGDNSLFDNHNHENGIYHLFIKLKPYGVTVEDFVGQLDSVKTKKVIRMLTHPQFFNEDVMGIVKVLSKHGVFSLKLLLGLVENQVGL
jgi:hypothetical protein